MVKKSLLLAMLCLGLKATAQRQPYIDESLKPFVYECLTDIVQNGIFPTRYNTIDSIIITPLTRKICGDTIYNGCMEEDHVGTEIKHRRVYLQIYTPGEPVNEENYYKYLMYHEMGHALFGLGHEDRHLAIMNSQSANNEFGSRDWRKFHKEYIQTIKNKLFTKKKTT